MTEPVISQWVLYLIAISEEVKIFLAISSVFVFAAGLILTLVILSEQHPDDVKKLKYTILMMVLSGVMMITSVMIPKTDWLIAMVVNSYATPENLQEFTNNGQLMLESFKEFIFEFLDRANHQVSTL